MVAALDDLANEATTEETPSAEANGAAAAPRTIPPEEPEFGIPHLAGKDLSGSKLTKANQGHGSRLVRLR
jgi:hypothetical protein